LYGSIEADYNYLAKQCRSPHWIDIDRGDIFRIS
jgi:hypothetical protein